MEACFSPFFPPLATLYQAYTSLKNMASILKKFTFRNKKGTLRSESLDREVPVSMVTVNSPATSERPAAGLDPDEPDSIRKISGGRARAQSDASGFARRKQVAAMVPNSVDDGVTGHNPPHYIMYHMDRRRAWGPEELCRSLGTLNATFGSGEQLDATNKEAEPVMTIIMCTLEGGSKREVMKPRVNQTLREILEEAMIKNGYDIESLDTAPITALQNGSSVDVDLNCPSHQYLNTTIEVTIHCPAGDDGKKEESPVATLTIKECLDHFSRNGLVELPNTHCDEDSYHLPRVDPSESIPQSWNDLPIPADVKSSMSMKQLELQQKIWELIATEHSHLNYLKTVINLFMQSLELIRRAHLLVEDSYHNVFGYMEDIHNAHDDFWNHSLQPCVEKTLKSGCLLDIEEILQRFPQFSSHFDIYRQHCPLESLNLQALTKAMLNPDFEAYIRWCESHPQCKRLRLKDFLAMPMQRLTKYPLLLGAILKALPTSQQKDDLNRISEEVKVFVQSVNSVVRIQEETERVRDAMTRISDYVVMDNPPPKLKEELRAHRLDLLAPMPGVEVDQPRMLLLEGSLKYRDQFSALVVHVFLFTDLILITKPTKNKYSVVKPPYKITSIVLQTLEPDTIGVIVLSDYLDVASTWFSLKASSESIVKSWMERITSAQQLYRDALERQEVNWRTIQCLRSERILNGIERQYHPDLDMEQSRWSILSNAADTEVAERTSPPLPSKLNLTRTHSADTYDTTSSPSTAGPQTIRHSPSSDNTLSPWGISHSTVTQLRHLSIPTLQSKGHAPSSPRQGRRAYSVDAGTQTDLLFSMQRSSSSFGSMDISTSSGSVHELVSTQAGMLDHPGHQLTRSSKHTQSHVVGGATVADQPEEAGSPSPPSSPSSSKPIRHRAQHAVKEALPLASSKGQAKLAARRTTLKKCPAYDASQPLHSPVSSQAAFFPLDTQLVPAKSPSQLPLLQVEDCSNPFPRTEHFTWDIVMLNYPPGIVTKSQSEPSPSSQLDTPSQQTTSPSSQKPVLSESTSTTDKVAGKKQIKPCGTQPKRSVGQSTREVSVDQCRQRTQIPAPAPRKLSKASPRKETRKLSNSIELSSSVELSTREEQLDNLIPVSSPKKSTSRRSSREEGAALEQAQFPSPGPMLRYRAGSFRRVQRVGRQVRPGSGGDRKPQAPPLPDYDVWLRSHVRRSHRAKGGALQGDGKVLPLRRVSTEKLVHCRHQSAEATACSNRPEDCGQGLKTTQGSQTNMDVTDLANAALPGSAAHRQMKHAISVPSTSHGTTVKRTRSSAVPVKAIARSLSLDSYKPAVLSDERINFTTPVLQKGKPAQHKIQITSATTSSPGRIKHSDLQQTRSSSQEDDDLNSPSDKGHVLHSGGLTSPSPQALILPFLQSPPLQTTTPHSYSRVFETKASGASRSPLQLVQDSAPQQMEASLPNDAPQVKRSQSAQPRNTKASAPPPTPTKHHAPSEEGKSLASQRSKTQLVEQDTSTPQDDRTLLPPVHSKEVTSKHLPSHHHPNQTPTLPNHHHSQPSLPHHHNQPPPTPSQLTLSAVPQHNSLPSAAPQHQNRLSAAPQHHNTLPSAAPPHHNTLPSAAPQHHNTLPSTAPQHHNTLPSAAPQHHNTLPSAAPQHHNTLLSSSASSQQHYSQPQQSVTTPLPEQQHHHILFSMVHRRNKSYPAMVTFEDQPQLSGRHHGAHRTMEGKGLRPSSLTCSGLLSIQEEAAWSPVHPMDPDNEAKSM